MSRRRQRKAVKEAKATVTTTTTNTNTSTKDEWGSVTFKPGSPVVNKNPNTKSKSHISSELKSKPKPKPVTTIPTPTPISTPTPTPTPTPELVTKILDDSKSKNSTKSKSISTTKTSKAPEKIIITTVDAEEDEDTMELPTSALSLTFKGATKYILLKDQPCRIISCRMKKKSTNKGNDRMEIKGLHILTGKLYQDTIVGTVMVPVLKVKFKQYTLLDIDTSDGSVSLMDDEGKLKEDAVLGAAPDSMDPFDTIGMDCIKRYQAGEELIVVIFTALGRDVVVEVKKDDAEDDAVV